jgi:outer membrane protein TolC
VRRLLPLLLVPLLLLPTSGALAQLPEDGGAPSALPQPLTLADAMALGRQRARAVAAAEARRTASQERLREARGHRLPTVRLQEIWMRTDSPAEAFALTLNQERFSFQDFVAGDPNQPDPVNNGISRLEVELPLYTGGELSSRIQQAELASRAAAHGAEGTADGAALAAATAYLRLAQASEQVALLERSLETVRAHADTARSYVEQGMLVRSELLRAEVEQARLEDLLEAARGGVRVARAALAFRLVAEPEEIGDLPPLPPPPPAQGDLDGWLTAAEERPDLAAARLMARTAELEIEARKALLKPRVGLVVRGDLVDDVPFGNHGDSTAIIAQGSLDLWAGGSHRAAVAAARAEAEAARQDVEQLAESVRLEVRQAWLAADTARRRQATAASAIGAAREAERITGERFRGGVVKTLDLLDAATARREAETRELVARADANLAALSLAVAAGRDPESALRPPASPEPVAGREPSPEAADRATVTDPTNPELPRTLR